MYAGQWLSPSFTVTQVALGNDLPGSIMRIEHLSPTRNYPITWHAPVNEANTNNNKNSFAL